MTHIRNNGEVPAPPDAQIGAPKNKEHAATVALPAVRPIPAPSSRKPTPTPATLMD